MYEIMDDSDLLRILQSGEFDNDYLLSNDDVNITHDLTINTQDLVSTRRGSLFGQVCDFVLIVILRWTFIFLLLAEQS